MNNVVQIRNVSRSYMLGGQQVNALKNITLDIEDGELTALGVQKSPGEWAYVKPPKSATLQAAS